MLQFAEIWSETNHVLSFIWRILKTKVKFAAKFDSN